MSGSSSSTRIVNGRVGTGAPSTPRAYTSRFSMEAAVFASHCAIQAPPLPSPPSRTPSNFENPAGRPHGEGRGQHAAQDLAGDARVLVRLRDPVRPGRLKRGGVRGLRVILMVGAVKGLQRRASFLELRLDRLVLLQQRARVVEVGDQPRELRGLGLQLRDLDGEVLALRLPFS